MRATSICSSVCVAIAFATAHALAAERPAINHFEDPLATAAALVPVKMLPGKPILVAANIPDRSAHRIVAAGLRGLVLVSDDGGRSWRQARVPVQSDLTSLSFASAREGWAVGHDGIILHSGDGGENWQKQFDGNLAHQVLTSDYRKRIDAGEAGLKPYLDEIELNTKDGPILPFLGVFFENDHVGYAVGSFGMLVRTTDGGQTWHPWLDHIDNPKFLNLNDIREIGGNIYIAGEQGSVFRFDRDLQRFVSISPGYQGSFFHIAGNGHYLLVMGLNGTAFRSADEGKTWTRVDTGVHSSLTSAALSRDGQVAVLVAQGGQVIATVDEGKSFRRVPMSRPMLFADVAACDGADQFVFAGYQGIERLSVRGEPAAPATHQ